MFEVREIAPAEAIRIVAVDEGHFADAKDIRITPTKLTRTVSAFCNASGGEIFLGITGAQKGKQPSWEGFAAREDANQFIEIIDKLTPLANHYVGTFLKCPGHNGLVLHLTVHRTADIVKSHEGVVYVRRNAQNVPYNTQAMLKQLALDKGIVTFENEPIAIDAKRVLQSETAKNFLKSIAPSAAKKPRAWFDSELLFIGKNPIAAAVLLFDANPQAALPKRSAVKLFRYKTSAKEGFREFLDGQPQTIEGPVYDLISNSVAATKQLVEGVRKLGLKNLENIEYPHDTLHEIVTNAVLHRDYSIATDIQIRVFDNRIEVESPGKFPGHVTVLNFLESQAARNGKLVRLINKFPNPPNKDVGEGLNTAFNAMHALQLKAPYVRETDNSVIFIIEHAPLASAEESILEYLKNNPTITNSIVRRLTGIRSENSVKDVFNKLKNRSILERVPGLHGNKAAWKLVKKDDGAGG